MLKYPLTLDQMWRSIVYIVNFIIVKISKRTFHHFSIDKTLLLTMIHLSIYFADEHMQKHNSVWYTTIIVILGIVEKEQETRTLVHLGMKRQAHITLS